MLVHKSKIKSYEEEDFVHVLKGKKEGFTAGEGLRVDSANIVSRITFHFPCICKLFFVFK
jgi:hypothetical protein